VSVLRTGISNCPPVVGVTEIKIVADLLLVELEQPHPRLFCTSVSAILEVCVAAACPLLLSILFDKRNLNGHKK
jgi:hypothetical protein